MKDSNPIHSLKSHLELICIRGVLEKDSIFCIPKYKVVFDVMMMYLNHSMLVI